MPVAGHEAIEIALIPGSDLCVENALNRLPVQAGLILRQAGAVQVKQKGKSEEDTQERQDQR
jgi:hypothetical protein